MGKRCFAVRDLYVRVGFPSSGKKPVGFRMLAELCGSWACVIGSTTSPLRWHWGRSGQKVRRWRVVFSVRPVSNSAFRCLDNGFLGQKRIRTFTDSGGLVWTIVAGACSVAWTILFFSAVQG